MFPFAKLHHLINQLVVLKMLRMFFNVPDYVSQSEDGTELVSWISLLVDAYLLALHVLPGVLLSEPGEGDGVLDEHGVVAHARDERALLVRQRTLVPLHRAPRLDLAHVLIRLNKNII